jgi:hypothetical protein
MAIWYICWLFGIFFPVSVSITEKKLATLVQREVFIEAHLQVSLRLASFKKDCPLSSVIFVERSSTTECTHQKS